jgi:hypothetical protein
MPLPKGEEEDLHLLGNSTVLVSRVVQQDSSLWTIYCAVWHCNRAYFLYFLFQNQQDDARALSQSMVQTVINTITNVSCLVRRSALKPYPNS